MVVECSASVARMPLGAWFWGAAEAQQGAERRPCSQQFIQALQQKLLFHFNNEAASSRSARSQTHRQASRDERTPLVRALPMELLTNPSILRHKPSPGGAMICMAPIYCTNLPFP